MWQAGSVVTCRPQKCGNVQMWQQALAVWFRCSANVAACMYYPAVWFRCSGVCWHSTVCLLPSERVTGRQEEEDREGFEKWKVDKEDKEDKGDKEGFENWKEVNTDIHKEEPQKI